MDDSQTAEVGDSGGATTYSSPKRILARAFRMSRDKWREKHHLVQAKLEQQRQLASERAQSRDQWRDKCLIAQQRAEVAEALAQQRLDELDRLRAQQKYEPELSQLAAPKKLALPKQ